MTVPIAIANTIVDPKAYAAATPVDEAFIWLRKNAPFERIEPEGYDPLWVATRMADVRSIELQAKQFCSGANLPTLAPRDVLKARAESGFTGARTLVSMDPPEHGLYRRMTQSWFMPSNLRDLESRIRVIARRSIEEMIRLGTSCDFAKDIAFYYPLRVVMSILGIPEAEEAYMLKLTQQFFAPRDPDFSRDIQGSSDAVRAQASLQATVSELREYFARMTADRRRNPTGDLASAIANGKIDGELIGVEEAIGYYVITATAGHDTTSNANAEAVWALAERPALLKRLKEDPDHINAFITESIRWGTPVKHFMRTATEDVEFAGRSVAKGELVMLSYASANRDEDVFHRPFCFDIDRQPNPHVAFGYGPHVCLGQHLALLELRLFWQELITRLEGLDLNGAPERTQSNFVSGPKSLPITYKMS